MITNDTTALMNTPTPNRLLLIVKASAEKSGTPPRAPISGVIKLLTNASTTSLNAAPTTTATARSTTFPRSRNLLKPDMPLPSRLECAQHRAARSPRQAPRGVEPPQPASRVDPEPPAS